FPRQRRAGGDFSDDRFEVVHRVGFQDWVSSSSMAAGQCQHCSGDYAQLLAPVTCAKAAWLMEVPITDSILATYCATCSSVSPRCKVAFNFFSSSEEAS